MSDHEIVTSYATHGLRLWAASKAPHGPTHGCLSCSDARRYIDEPLVPNVYRAMVVPDEEWGPDSATQLMERGPV